MRTYGTKIGGKLMRRIRLYSIADDGPMSSLREGEVLTEWDDDFLNGWKSRKSL
ncbi:MAG TPA: hypothetical protein VJK52_03665 [Candidatus Nanoarchaeia archaeon]|nr:hypothetical protein [Candidatus Nanoarchaeia archaeon]